MDEDFVPQLTRDSPSIRFHADFQIWDAESVAPSRQESDKRGKFVMSRPDDVVLRQKARAAIRSGKLPPTRPDRRFGGPGNGTECAVCGEPVERHQMGFEIEFNRHGVAPGLDRYHLHPRCYAAWDSERITGTGSTPGDHPSR